MATLIPPPHVEAAFTAPVTRHTRRIEIYEADGVTRWVHDKLPRLITGEVVVEHGRAERRSIDLTLDNFDGVLVNAPGGFWYDKIIKAFRGVELKPGKDQPTVLLAVDDELLGLELGMMLKDAGYEDLVMEVGRLLPDASNMPNIDMLVACKRLPASTVAGYRNAGVGVVILHAFTAIDYLSTALGSAPATGVFGGGDVRIVPAPGGKTEGAWNPMVISTTLGEQKCFRFTPTATLTIEVTGAFGPVGYLHDRDIANGKGGVFALSLDLNRDFEQSNIADLRLLLGVATRSIMARTLDKPEHWEVQVGEFMIDKISKTHMPKTIKITGRDYTKKCQNSKYPASTQYSKGQKLENLVRTVAVAAGIPASRMILPVTSVTVTSSPLFERGVTRWEALDDICTPHNYEVIFDANGFLVLRMSSDPASSAPVFTFRQGPDGNVVTYEASSADTRIYNSIVVTGESSDSEIPPVYATAKNTDPSSPTSIQALGERVYQYTSSFINTTAQAQAVADNLLTMHALEEYEFNINALMLPWLDSGDIVRWIDTDRAPDDPDTYLLSSLRIPLSLGPMSATGKRVIKVEQP